MTTVAKLSADLVANTSGFETGLGRANRALSNSAGIWAKSLKQTDGNFAALGGSVSKLTGTFGLLSGAVTGLLGSGFVLIAKGAINAASAINDTADRLQITTGELQRYQFAAKLSGVESDLLETALTKLNAKLADGSLKYANTSEAFNSISDAVKNASSDTERAAIVNDAFGAKLGAKLIPVLSGGSAGLRELGDEAERTGNVISDNTIRKADDLGDALDVLGSTITKNFQQGLLDSFVEKSGELKKIYDDPEFTHSIRNIGTVIGEVTAKAVEGAGTLAGYIIKLEDFYKKAGSFKFGLSQETFDTLKGEPYNNQRSSLQPYRIGTDQYGPAPKVATPTSKPYVFSADRKAADDAASDAAKQATRDAEQRIKTTQSVLDGVKQENAQLRIQTDLYGQKESAIKRAQKEQEINNQLTQAGITLTQSQRKELENSLDTYQKQTELQEQQQKVADRLKDQEKNRQQALDQLGSTIESSFESAIIEGDKLSDVLDSLFKDVAKLLLRKNIIEPLFTGLSKDGGIFDSIGKSLFSGLPSFAVGTDYVSRDMTANIHKGEMIIPAKQAAALRSGSGGNGGVTVNITNNAGARVSTSSSQGADGTSLTVMIDQAVARNIAQKGSQTNQALAALSGQSLIRR